MNANTTNKNFTLNFFKKTICGSKKAFAWANQGSGDAYNELMALMNAHPDFELEVVKPKKNESKETYNGMNYQFMRDYISLEENAELLLKKLEKVIETAKKTRASAYPVVKRWFLRTFGESVGSDEYKFDFEEAKARIEKADDESIFAAADAIEESTDNAENIAA